MRLLGLVSSCDNWTLMGICLRIAFALASFMKSTISFTVSLRACFFSALERANIVIDAVRDNSRSTTRISSRVNPFCVFTRDNVTART